MTNEEINKYIHGEIMGLCWHELKGGRVRPAYCVKDCGLRMSIRQLELAGGASGVNPDYCSDDSPRRLLNEVVAKVTADGVPFGTYENILFELIRVSHERKEWSEFNNSYLTFLFVHATAEQIARTCVEAIKKARKMK